MPKSPHEMTAEETQNYLDAHSATENSLNSALTKFQTLAAGATTPAKKAEYNAAALEATRELALLSNKRAAFDADTAIISPPDRAMVQRTQRISAQVAQIQATEGNFQAIVAGMTSAANLFKTIQA